jgi:hypothetical protein
MRTTIIAAGILALSMTLPARADENNKLTILSFDKPVQLPGVTLPAGKYRFELADTVGSRRAIKVQSDDGKQQVAMLQTMPLNLLEPAKDPIVVFGETPRNQPEAVKAWVYPGESIGYEFVYPREQAITIAKEAHIAVLSNSGDKIERIDENGRVVNDKDDNAGRK